MHAAVVALRAEVARWFAWRIDAPMVDELIESGRLRAVGDSITVLGTIADR